MNDEERRLLGDLLGRLEQIRGVQKDPEAAAMIAAALQRQPDAAYLLVQKVLLQDQALAAARSEIERLQAQPADAGRAGGFLGNSAWGPGAASGGGTATGAGAWREPAAAQPRAFAAPAGMGSFLGSAAATAAGVAAGAFLFQGLGGLLGHHDWTGGNGLLGAGRSDGGAPAGADRIAADPDPGAAEGDALSGLGPDDDGSFGAGGDGIDT